MSAAPSRRIVRTREAARADVHATCIVLGQVGILLRGEPGAGKSDLALRMIETGARLVADDRVRLAREGMRVAATVPAALAGLIEVRGLGIVRLAADRHAPKAAVGLVCDLVAPGEVDRLPEPTHAEILGVSLPLVRLDPFTASAPVKLRLAAGFGPGSIMVGA